VNRLLLPILTALLFVAAGCPKRATVLPPPQDAEIALEQAVANLEAGKYRQAEDALTFIIFNFPGSRQASDAQYFLAESYFRAKDYVQAQTEFDFYIKSFPNGRFQEEATYKLAQSYLESAPGRVRDQARALQAREIVDGFIETWPDSPLRAQAEQLRAQVDERLALKEFDAARLYGLSGEYKSALVYYQYILDTYPQAAWEGADRLRLGICYAETGSPDKARTVFEGIVAGDYEPETKELAKARLSRLP
jgi:outer membrane protein assembly factor BamD